MTLPSFQQRRIGTFLLTILCVVASLLVSIQYAHATPVSVFSDTLPTSGSSVNGSLSVSYTLSMGIAGGSITFMGTDGTSDRGGHVYNLSRDDETVGTHTFTRRTLEAGFVDPLVDGAIYTITFSGTDAFGNPAIVSNTSVLYDVTPPADPVNFHIFSTNNVSTLAKVGDTVVVTAAVETGVRVSGTIGGKIADGAENRGTGTLTRVLDGTETEGSGLNFTFITSDGAANASSVKTKTSIADESSVQTDFTPPVLPIATPAAGSFSATQSVSLSSSGSTTILFTTDGTVPTCTLGTAYSHTLSISSTTTVKAIGCDAAGNGSAVQTFVYTIGSGSGGGGGSSGGSGITIVIPYSPTVTPSAGAYTGTQSVSLASMGSTSIRYTIDGTTPSCTTGSVYATPISISATKTIKVRGCNSAGSSPIGTFVFTIKSAPPSGASGSGGSTGTITLPANPVSILPLTAVPNTNTGSTPTVTAPVASAAVFIHDPAQYQTVLTDFGLQSDPKNFGINQSLVQADAKTFGVPISAEQVRFIANFITYGASTETIQLGMGERHAVIRDYLQTVGRADVAWDDVQRMTIGQKPVKRNLAKEQAQVPVALAAFVRMTGHSPNFQDASEDLAWNTLMYRIRFPRNLGKEHEGILAFEKILKRVPISPFDWAEVRALGYVLP
ncbi:MAG: chitobiase/beta-hexosaminidase C-terminal domain-containing protein [Candidatus Uhrbacteria bacterium]|nr:chitobiase/beta-hexosaminidase C-terminal domain-containing protein [Candidatus Uhrbacteria bacterium]